MSEIIELDLSKIEVGSNVRHDMDEGALETLAQSIKDVGQLSPVTVTPNGGDVYHLETGHRRVEAVRLGIEDGVLHPDTKVLAIVAESKKGADRTVVQLIENLQREDLTPIEEAEGYLALKEQGVKQAEIAKRVGRNPGHVSKRLKLLRLPDDVQNLVARGHVNIEAALELPGLPDSEALRLARKGQALTVREVKQVQAAAAKHQAEAKLNADLEERGLTVYSSAVSARSDCPKGQIVVTGDPVTDVDDIPKRAKGVVLNTWAEPIELRSVTFRKPTANELKAQAEEDAEREAVRQERDAAEAQRDKALAEFVESPPSAAELLRLMVVSANPAEPKPSALEIRRTVAAEVPRDVLRRMVSYHLQTEDPAVFETLIGVYEDAGAMPLSDWERDTFVANWQAAIDYKEQAEANEAEESDETSEEEDADDE